MWGGGVETESSGAASAASPAWGGPVGAPGGSDTAWMSSGGGGGQSNWGGSGGAKTGWDTQQQQNLVGSSNTAGQSAGSSWQSAPSNNVNPANGWGGAANTGPTNWNTGTGQQWTGTSPGGGSTWAGVAGRHAPTTSTSLPQAPVQQVAGSNPAAVVTTPTAVAVRPKASFDNTGSVGWGKPVDQGTPWEVRAGEAAPSWGAGAGGGGGGGGGNSGGGGTGWSNPQHSNTGGNLSRESSWQAAPAETRDTTGSYGGYGGGKPMRSVGGGGQGDGRHWGGSEASMAGGSGWDAMPSQRHSSSGGAMWNASGGMEQHQRDAPANVWTGPPPPQDPAESHMIWTNPFPKKTAQPDKGTNVWGDPSGQGDIKRWKTNPEGDILPAVTGLQATTPTNAQQTQSASGTGSNNSGTPTQPVQTASGMGGGAWKDSSTPTPQQQQTPTTPSWNSENVGPNSVSSPPSGGTGGWGDNVQSGTNAPGKTFERTGILDAGWVNNGGKQIDPSRNSIESDGGNVSDDVFSSNPTTPLSAGSGPPGQTGPTMILNKQQQQLPNGLGLHSSQGSNQNLNQLVADMATAKIGQNVHAQNMSFNATGSSMANNTVGRVAQQLMTQQIADQLTAAVQAGLIDSSILHQPLPQDVLLRLNQLLQCVPKLEKARKEMMQLQAQAGGQPQNLSAAQQQEFQRLSSQEKQLRQAMTTLKQAIVAQTQAVSAGNGQRNAPGNGNGDGGQSKLEQWKRGSTNGVDSGCGPAGSNVFGVSLSGNPNDPWSNTPAKRNSGADWPQSAATTPGDMPKSPDKQMDGRKENDQNSENTHRSTSPANMSGSGNDSTGGAGLTTPTLLDDVPEFKPGQPWNWRDPKELAEDPDATPGSVIKRPTLLNSVSSMVNAADLFTNSTAGGNQNDLMGGGGFAGSAVNFGGNSGPLLGGGGPGNFGAGGGMPSSFYGMSKGGMTGMSGPVGFGGPQQGGFGDSWAGGMPRVSRPPSQMGQPIGGRAPFKHSMSTPNQSAAQGFMPPYNMGNAAPVQWVVLTNLNVNMDETSLQMMMSRIAPVSSCIYPPGTGFAVVKFKDISLDKVLPRLQQECAAVGVTIQLAKDDEVSRLIQAVTGQRAGSGPPGGGGGGHMFGPPPPPPPHHPGAMGHAIWDAPPPHAGGPWGPPPPQAGGLHHHGGAPFAPHHAALGDPTLTAMSMAMPPAIHDGIFGPVGHDRHAPF